MTSFGGIRESDGESLASGFCGKSAVKGTVRLSDRNDDISRITGWRLWAVLQMSGRSYGTIQIKKHKPQNTVVIRKEILAVFHKISRLSFCWNSVKNRVMKERYQQQIPMCQKRIKTRPCLDRKPRILTNWSWCKTHKIVVKACQKLAAGGLD